MGNDPSDAKLDRLFAAARKAELYTADKEYGFEARVMTKIRGKREGLMPFGFWAWRLIPVLVSLVILMGILMYASEPRYTIDLNAMTGTANEEAVLTAFLTGE